MKKITEIKTIYAKIFTKNFVKLHFATVRSDWGRGEIVGLMETFRAAEFIEMSPDDEAAFLVSCESGLEVPSESINGPARCIDIRDFLKRFALARGFKPIEDIELEFTTSYTDMRLNKTRLKAEWEGWLKSHAESNGWDGIEIVNNLFDRKGDKILLHEIEHLCDLVVDPRADGTLDNPDENSFLKYMQAAFLNWKWMLLRGWAKNLKVNLYESCPDVSLAAFNRSEDRRGYRVNWLKWNSSDESWKRSRI